jgi:hypothetical protein
MAVGFAGALGRGALQAARGATRARPSSTLSALRAGEAELLQTGVGSRAGLSPLPRARPTSEVPWTPSTSPSELIGGSPEATALFQRTRLELGLAEMADDPEIFKGLVNRIVREGRLSRMGRDEAGILEDSITQVADKLGVRAYSLSKEAVEAMPGKAGTTAFRSIGNRNSVENALRNAQNERQLSELYEFAVSNVDLADRQQRVWFNNLLINIESKTDDLVKQSLLRQLRTSPEALERQVFPDNVKAQMARILKVKPEDLQTQLANPDEIVEMFYNSRAARSFGSAALPSPSAAFNPANYITAIRSSFKPQEIQSLRVALNDRYRKGFLTAEQAQSLQPIFRIQEEAVAKGRFNRMIEHFEREAKGIGDSIRSDVRFIRQLNDPEFVRHQEKMRVRKGRGPRRPWSDEGMPIEEGKGTGGFSWGGKEGERTLQQWLTESLGEASDERSRNAARAILNRNLPQNDPYMRTRPMRRNKAGNLEEVPLDEYRRMGPEAREELVLQRVPISYSEAGLSKPHVVSSIREAGTLGPRTRFDTSAQQSRQVGDFRRIEAGLTKQEWIDERGYQRLLELKNADTNYELNQIWTRIEVAKYNDLMDEDFFNILLNAYREKALTLRGRVSPKQGRRSRRGEIDRPTVEDLYRDSFTDMDEMLNYQGLVRGLRDAGTATVRM